jgi:hypothetical protein
MRWLETTAELVHLWLPRLLPGVRDYFILVGTSKSYLRRPREMYDPGPYTNRVLKVCGVLIGFSPAGCTSIRITVTLRYEYNLFVAVIT